MLKIRVEILDKKQPPKKGLRGYFVKFNYRKNQQLSMVEGEAKLLAPVNISAKKFSSFFLSVCGLGFVGALYLSGVYTGCSYF